MGRQFLSQGLDFFNFDGLWAKTHPIKNLGVHGFAGLPVLEEEGDRRSGDSAVGGGVSWAPIPNSFFGITYRREERRSDLQLEQGGLDIQIPVGSHVRLVGNLAYDIPLEEFVESLAGVRFYSNLVNVSVEYWRFLPHFDLESIFNVFNFGAIDEVRGQVTYFFTRNIRAGVRLTRQFFEDTLADDDENDIARLTFDWDYPTYGGTTILESVGAEIEYQDGFQGIRKAIELHASKRLFTRRFIVNGAVGLTTFQQFFPEDRGDTDTDLLLRLGGTYVHENGWGAQIEVERLHDEFTGAELRVFLSVNIAFNAIF